MIYGVNKFTIVKRHRI